MNKTRLTETFTDLLKINSPSYSESELAKYIASRFRKKKIKIFRDQSYKNFKGKCGNIHAVVGAKKASTPILFASHMDTVVPTRGLKFVEKDGMYHSDGKRILGADNKAGVAVAP